MKNFDKERALIVIGGFIAVLAMLAVGMPVGGATIVGFFIGLIGIFGAPFISAYAISSKLWLPSVRKAKTPARAACAGINGGLCIVVMVSSVLGIVFSIASGGVDPISMFGGVLLFVICGLGWAGLPALLFGSAFGLHDFCGRSNERQSRQKRPRRPLKKQVRRVQ